MVDIERVITGLRYCSETPEWNCDKQCPYGENGKKEAGACWVELNRDALALLTEYRELNERRWVPVCQRLPEEKDGRVLICMPDKFPYNQNQPFPGCEVSERVTTGKYSEFSKRWYIGDMCGVCGDGPIAWMPLPEPPMMD